MYSNRMRRAAAQRDRDARIERLCDALDGVLMARAEGMGGYTEEKLVDAAADLVSALRRAPTSRASGDTPC